MSEVTAGSDSSAMQNSCLAARKLNNKEEDMMAVAASTAGGIHTPHAQNMRLDHQVVSGGRKDSEPERVGGKIPARFENTAVSWKEALCCMI